ncbi:MAG TPA: hypothetical protein V6D48_25030 [Oculatellaceae cyanobacterium]
MSEVVGIGGNAKRFETIFQGVTFRIEKAAGAFWQRQVCILHSLLSVAFNACRDLLAFAWYGATAGKQFL